MKILHFSSFKSSASCGVGTYAEDLIRSMAPLENLQNDTFGVDSKELELAPYKRVKEILQECVEASQGYDVVHVQHEHKFFKTGAYGFEKSVELAAWFYKSLKSKKIFATFHIDPFFYSPTQHRDDKDEKLWRRKIAPLLGPKTHRRIIVHNEFIRQMLVKAGHDSATIFRHAHPIKYLAEVSPDKEFSQKITNALSLDSQSIVLSTLGYVIPQKGIDSCIEALKLLPENYKLIIGGGAPSSRQEAYVKEITERIAVMGLEKRAMVTGYVSEAQIRSLFCLTHLFLFLYAPPYPSSSGAVTLALQSSCPILASNLKLFLEIEKEGKCLETCFYDPPGEVARKVKEMMDSPELCQRLVENARRYCQAHTWAQTGSYTAQLYQSA